MLPFDGSLGALDAKARRELRQDMRDIHDETGLTTSFVTHDQAEAMALADLVVVMSMGRIEQIDKPQDIRAKPAITVFESYDEIVAACCSAWNDFATNPKAIASITSRTWAEVK